MAQHWLRGLGIVALSLGMLASSATPARASRSISGTVNSITVVAGTTARAYVWLTVTSASGSSSQCTPTAGWADGMAFNINSDKGKGLLNALTAAWLSGKPISLNEGDLTCLSVGGGVNMYTLDRLQVWNS